MMSTALGDQDLAVILAALRVYQTMLILDCGSIQSLVNVGMVVATLEDHFSADGLHKPTTEEIDALCEKLNQGLQP